MSAWLGSPPPDWKLILENTIREDVGTGDLTAPSFPETALVNWVIEAQSEAIICGLGFAEELLKPTLESHSINRKLRDGDSVHPGTIAIEGRNQTAHVLTAERTALNFLMMLSGVATLTSKYVKAVEGYDVRIVDTRKTVPLLRSLQKYAVRCGGGHNHRMGLYDAAMIKDKHIAAHGSISAAVAAVRATVPHTTLIEVECESAEMVEEALSAEAEVILLDNMAPDAMKAIMDRHKGKAVFEASGGVNLETVRTIAASGVDVISVGALTHSAVAASLHMEFN